MGMHSQKDGRTVLSEINVTPFVDVMLVLLVIFMVTAPILYHGVNVSLPKVESKPIPAAESSRKLVITIDKKGGISIDNKSVSLSKLKLKVRAVMKKRGQDVRKEHVFLRADASVPYGRVIEVMAEIKNAGVEKVGLITEPLGVKGRRAGSRR